MKCRTCKHNYKPRDCEPRCNLMCDGQSDYEAITNADKIRAMSDEELATWLFRIDHYRDDGEWMVRLDNVNLHDGKEEILEWLQTEVEG